MIIIFIIFFFISFVVALKRPTYFVIIYILVSTKFLGIINIEESFIIGGLGLGLPVMNLITFMANLIILFKRKAPKIIIRYSVLVLPFCFFGIFYPLILGYETIFQALIASKEFWTISLLFYLIVNSKVINRDIILKFIEYIGLYLAFIYIVYIVFKLAPPAYETDYYVRVNYPTYISLSAFLYYIKYQTKKISLTTLVFTELILFIGIVLAGHFSLVIGTTFSLAMIILIYKDNHLSIVRLFYRSTFLLTVLLVTLILSSNTRNLLSNEFAAIIGGTDVALSSRDIYNSFRWEAISERPLFGYGFIHKSTEISQKFITLQNNRFSESFGVIDSGYVDIIIKFGYLGAFLFLAIWGSLFVKILISPQKYQVIQILMAAYLLQYYLIAYTWSVFTFSHGLIPAFLAIYFMNFSRKQYG